MGSLRCVLVISSAVSCLTRSICEPKRFAQLSKVLPIMPVFGGGKSRFQPVYVEDVARIIEIMSRKDEALRRMIDGKITEVGGPDGVCSLRLRGTL